MTKRRGFTLLEMLVAVFIFSGLVILILGTFARSATSSAKVTELREKAEVARGLMGQITNDFRYLYLKRDFVDLDVGSTPKRGYYLTNERLVMLLRFPGAAENQLVRKEYRLNARATASTMTLGERRDCQLSEPGQLSCASTGISNSELMNQGYVLDYDQINEPTFSGREIDATDPASPTGFLKIQLTIKPSQNAGTLCSNPDMPDGSCYKVETTLVPGDLNT